MDTAEKALLLVNHALSHVRAQASHEKALVRRTVASFAAGVCAGLVIACFTASFWLKIAVLVLR